ncbi:hypothetical protein EQU06_01425 [Lactobacillus sanfranciscensis]|uniref:hypothetical protein n=1 Tax=Fructilactobacillus sanfranciscensis TaxID=1625 RepID=UPI0002DE1542|nr:hypothetical protein [Fructilactobacillus sanfranciscensis]NDR75525.1 hypothetical protein [Fructilactobacillus sanfranciscensis]NDR96282.1 hypothetical protein [Fructilactobacillus sanfranciscensis]NDS04059.1 hypothetical protein [Fructilactobacillus sanfranciscensis]POH19118.1 hypothetical protein BGL44_01915 [Fructilactobacillus sanfranciscensis]POH22374.1 hypothetical protein BGL47_02190 [Fructilactobacillus sanfranciscensis]
MVLKKDSQNVGEIDSSLVEFDKSQNGGFVLESKATKKIKNLNHSKSAQTALDIRAAMGSESLDISFAVSEAEIDLGDVILEKYVAENTLEQGNPCFIYYHGGDFYRYNDNI